MAKTTISFSIDEELKREFKKVCKENGLTMTKAITLFIEIVIREKRIPFEIRLSDLSRENTKNK